MNDAVKSIRLNRLNKDPINFNIFPEIKKLLFTYLIKLTYLTKYVN